MEGHRVPRRRFLRAVGGGGLLVASTGVASAGGQSQAGSQSQDGNPRHYLAYLTGANQVPPVKTGARGLAAFKYDPSRAALYYTLFAFNIEDMAMAHIHLGASDEAGPVVAWLYPDERTEPKQIDGNFGGVPAKDTIRASDLVGPLEGESMAALLDAIEAREAYVNVHTAANPGGEIRGQID